MKQIQRCQLLAMAFVLSAVFPFSSLAQPANQQDVAISYERTNTVTIAVEGGIPITLRSADDINRSVSGTEQSQCRAYGRKSGASTSSSANVSTSEPSHLTASLKASALANGGHFRTCVAGCAVGNCIGVLGNDTRADASASSLIQAKLAFSDKIVQDFYDLRIFSSLPNDIKLSIRAPDGSVTIPNSEITRISVKPGDIFYVEAIMSVSASDKGGCCSDSKALSGLFDIHVEKPPILSSRKLLEPYIVGGVQTEAFKNVVAILLKGELHCSGTVVAEKTILTAAHCIHGYESRIAQGDMTYLIGSVITSPQSGPFPIVQAVYPKGNDTIQYSPVAYDHDVGLLYTQTKIPVGAVALHQPSTAPAWSDIINKHALVFVGFGYNKTNEGDLVGLGVKRQAPWNANNADEWRFYFQAPGNNTCRGDSGGPAFYQNEATLALLLVGITSVGDKFCTYGADTRMDTHYSWVASRLR